MSIYMLLYLFFLAVLLSIILPVMLKILGPWGNPILFFLVLFMTSWSIAIWLEPVSVNGRSYPFLSVIALALLVALLLAATRTVSREKGNVRRLKDRKVIKVVTKPEEGKDRSMPGKYLWGLLMLESLHVFSAYLLRVL